MRCRQFFVSYNYSFQKQAVKNIVKPDFGTNLGLVNCGILFNRRLVIWGIRNLIVDQLLIGRQINRLFRDRGLFYKYWFLTGLINRILYSRTSSLRHLTLFKGHFHPGDVKFGPGKYSHNLFISVEGTPLFRGKGHFLNPRFFLHSRDTLVLRT